MTRVRTAHHLLLVNFTSFFSVPLIHAARERGMRVTALGPATAFERFPEVVELVDGRIVAGQDTVAVALAAEAHRRDRFTCLFASKDDSVELASRLAAYLDVPWNSPEAIRRMRNKWLTRMILAARGFRQPEHHLCLTATELTNLIQNSPGAWIVKPLKSTGSEGISRVATPGDVAASMAHLRTVQPEGLFLAERAIEPAREYSVEGVWQGDTPHVLAITAKDTTGPPQFVELGHTLPVSLAPSLDAQIRHTALEGLRVLGASHGLFHVEVFVDAKGVIFGEAHARAGGDRITQLLDLVGFDVNGLALDGMLSPSMESPLTPQRVAAIRYFRFPPGRLVSVDGLETLQTDPSVVYWRIDVKPGDLVKPVTSSFDRHGCFVLVGDTYAGTAARAEELQQSVEARLAVARASSHVTAGA